MSRLVGIEIGRDRMRAVLRRRRGAPETFEVPFVPDGFGIAVSELQALVGDVGGINIAIGLAHLHVKQVKLPPVAHAARRQMLMVEPDRWFALASDASAAIALDMDGTLAMAADGGFVETCVTAFARWAPVQRVEPAAFAVTRAFVQSGEQTVQAVVDAAPGEIGLLHIEGGILRGVRRVRAGDVDVTSLTARPIPLVETAFVTAYGASLATDDETRTMLLTPALEQRFASIARRRLAGWSMAAIAAACTAVWSLGVARERMLATLDEQIADARRAATVGNTAIARGMLIDRELAAIASTMSSRADGLSALAALGARLPAEAVAQRIRMVGHEWQVEGNASTASAVLAALAAEPRFDKVRFLAPSNRFRDGTEDRETFAIAFAVR